MGGILRWVFRAGSLIALLVPIFLFATTSGGVIANTSSECADVLILFARGSSSNPKALNITRPFSKEFEEGVPNPDDPSKIVGAEEIPGSFFRWMEKRIIADYPHIDYKAISVHYDPTKGYSQHGYPAVGIFNPDTVGNALQARFSWWKAGEYTHSVTSGSQELAGHIRDNVINCPNQRLVVGGYSQGAHVVHEALKLTTPGERNLIDNVVLFGDPKFISSDGNPWNPLDVHAVYPWVRGTAALKERGLGGAEIPYVPEDMRSKTISWCHEDDFVCTGFSGLSWATSKNMGPSGNPIPLILNYNAVFGEGHTRYPVFGVPEASAEVIDNLHTHFALLEKERGGIDPGKNPYQTHYDAGLTNPREIDVMLALNYTDGNQDAQAQYFLKLKEILKIYKKNFTNLRTGGMVYSDLSGDSSNPNRAYVAGLMRPMNQLSSNTDDTFKGNVIYPSMPGGGDYPENHGMAVERGSMFASWRPGAVKRFVIFAERPATTQYTFNICESATINALPHFGIYPCASGSKFQAIQFPEWCASIIEVLGSDVCDYHGASSSTKLISRTLADIVVLARAKGIVIDVVQPHVARDNQMDYPPQYVHDQFQTLADATGGLYLRYDVFDEPAMRDAIWKILTHQPKIMSISQHTRGTLLTGTSGSQLEPLGGLLLIPLGDVVLLSATPVSGAQLYGWDIDGDGLPDRYTKAPVLEHTFFERPLAVTVTAYEDLSATKILSTRIILTTEAMGPGNDYVIEPIPPLNNVETIVGKDTVAVKWGVPQEHTGAGIVAIYDAQTGVLLYTVPVNDGSAEIDLGLTAISLQYVDDGRESEPLELVIEPNQTEQPPTNEGQGVVANRLDDVGQTTDKTVSQDEPNSTQDSSSPALRPVQPEQASIAIVQSAQTQSRTYATISEVASAQDVQTNPQNNVGGIEEVNELFSDDDIGRKTQPESARTTTNPLLFVLGGVVVISLGLLAFIIFAKRQEEDEEDPPSDQI